MAEGARLREDEARSQSRQHAERARGSASQVEHLEEELSTLRSAPVTEAVLVRLSRMTPIGVLIDKGL